MLDLIFATNVTNRTYAAYASGSFNSIGADNVTPGEPPRDMEPPS